MDTVILKDDLSAAAEIIKNGGLVAVPTETVYGLAANGLDTAAVERLYEAKGRPAQKPISLFVADIDDAVKFCADIPEAAQRLAKRFWPGPLTMIFKRSPAVPDIITSGGEGVGIRCPDNAAALSLLKLCGVPLTGTSANLSGMPDALTFDEVFSYLNGRVEGIIDGGRCVGGVPSTVVDMTARPLKILRLGAISAEDIAAVSGEEVVL